MPARWWLQQKIPEAKAKRIQKYDGDTAPALEASDKEIAVPIEKPHSDILQTPRWTFPLRDWPVEVACD